MVNLNLILSVLVNQALVYGRFLYGRFIVRSGLTQTELQLSTLLSLGFWLHLSVPQILSVLLLAVIAGASFLFSVWLGSFHVGASFSLTGVISNVIGLAWVPLNLLLIQHGFRELNISHPQVILGIVLLEVAQLIAILAWWLIYRSTGV